MEQEEEDGKMEQGEEDIIDFVIINGSSNLSYEVKCQLKHKHPRPHISLEQNDGKSLRKFQYSWYQKYPWLTGSVVRDKLYCFVCLLFDGEREWIKTGVTTVKNFVRKAQKHQVAQSHIKNRERFHMLGRESVEHALSEGARARHNEKVTANRNILGRCIDVVCLLGMQELQFRSFRETDSYLSKGNYLEVRDLLAQEEILMRDHLDSNSVFNGTSSDVQDDIVATVTDALNDALRREIADAPFISVQVDETTDVSCECQLSIILRYCIEDRIEERFIGFYDVTKDKNADSLSTVILNVLKQWKVESKLVCQTYDGASVMAGQRGGVCVQRCIKEKCPHALFIHSYAHHLNLVLLHGSKTIHQVRVFISNLTAFRTFFSRTSKRTTLLIDQCFKLPNTDPSVWNYHSRAVTTIKAHFQELRRAFSHIIDNPDSDWDPATLNMAIGLDNFLETPTFVFFLMLFSRIFVLTHHVYNILQTESASDVMLCNYEIKKMIRSLKEMRNEDTVNACCEESLQLNANLIFTENISGKLKAVLYILIDSLTVQLETRFEDLELIDFVELVNKRQFDEFQMSFPEKKLQQAVKTYPYFDYEQLYNELKIIYSDPSKYKSPQDLMKYIVQNDLTEIYVQFTRFLRLVLTLPVTSASSDSNISTLKRIKNYLRHSMEDTRLSKLATLSIEKNLLKTLSKDRTFKDKVIDTFAASKDRRVELAYKHI